MSPIHPDDPEARAWLQANANDSALATNRFGTTAAALQFVEQLYAVGAIRVVVPRDCILNEPRRIAEEGGPYADALAFEVGPEHNQVRLREIVLAELEHEGFDEPVEGDFLKDGRFGYFWWD